MKKKIVAFGAGRRNGNTEIFIKEALLAAEETGVKVEYIRLNECNLQPCKGCLNMPCFKKGPAGCIHKDDGEWLIEKFLDSDGYLLGAPVWSLSPNSIVTVFRDRIFGPKMDVAVWEMMGTPGWAKGRMKHRPGGLISVGGAKTKNWTSLGIATLFTTTFSPQTEVVDYMDINRVADPGAATLNKALLEKAKKLGENLAYAVTHPEEGNHWMGEDEGNACPGCRQNLLIYKPGNNYMECAICGTTADIILKEGKVKLNFNQGSKDDRLTVKGKFTHQHEIFEMRDKEYTPLKAQILKDMEKYKAYESCVVKAPSRQTK